MSQPPGEHGASIIAATEGSKAALVFSGRLTSASLPQVWDKAMDAIRQAQPKHVVVELKDLAYCDGAGLGLFAEIRRVAAQSGADVEFTGATAELSRLVEMSKLSDPSAPQLVPPPRPGLVALVGSSAAGTLGELYAMVGFLGDVILVLGWVIAHPLRLKYSNVRDILEKVGATATPIICLLGFLIGVILAFQSVVPLERYGARSVVPAIVAVSAVRELGPLITAVLVAGRSGSAFAAEIGTMKITEELNALETLGLDPLRWLVAPRVIAAMLMTPLLSVLAMATSILGGYTIMANMGQTFLQYANSVKSSLTYVDVLGGVGKTIVFGFLIASAGCLRGIRTLSGPGAVGDSTTRAVVMAIIMIIVADGAFGVIYYYLGI